jgi:ADP-heptose:LPS heptosyltransferase
MRSIPLTAFEPLAQVPGVRLISLQRGHGTEQVAPLKERIPLHECGPDLDADGAFLDTAAIMMSLDLIISSDTAIPHLAGALGRPVWLALAFSPEWRWLRDRDDSPWYPTARLFRQSQPGHWAEMFEAMAVALAQSFASGDSSSA